MRAKNSLPRRFMLIKEQIIKKKLLERGCDAAAAAYFIQYDF